MSVSLRQSMAWIHGWLGLLAGWLLFAMFLTGTASYFRPEITRWMQPELHPQQVSTTRAAETAIAYLQRTGADDLQWYVYLPDARTPLTRIYQVPNPAAAPRQRRDEIQLDPATGRPATARETRGGEQFYRFHFQLQLPHPWGRWLAGLCAMFMLATILSGVITHKRIFADFFTLRWNKGQRSWLDAHNVSAVLALPYHAMITYTGLITLVTMYMPWPILANYKQPADFAQIAFGLPAERPATGTAAPLVAIAPLVADAGRRLGGPVARIIVHHPNDQAATISVARRSGTSIDAHSPTVTYDGATGRLLEQSGAGGAALATAGVMLGLHIAQFAGPALRWAYFAMGLTGVAMVGTGLLLWTAKRRRPGAAAFFGLRLVERLNIAVIVGLPIGMAAYLLANRLIPAMQPGRADAEVATMFWAWGLVALAQLLRPARRAWREGFTLAALAFAAIPIADALTTTRGLPGSLRQGDSLFAAFDVAMLVIAALFAFAAWRAGRAPAPRSRRAARAERLSETVHA
ncbi:PepSY-associated TM helix domain-containing protein [Sphingomonas abaci]|uniref:Putative iron-regulated membrane protein n=1 Tax=Sphingomonas abaci TaxID=237611 RepID=A0A7W7AMA6_9SPHN|nr:PepSY-associated TM helix domain-containing protein [Sphingomonas abaci]MBB4619702.1 putative iron-regulated membrane protein [Sphingomonas abaci]